MKKLIALAALVVCLAVPAMSSASTSSCSAYNPQICQVVPQPGSPAAVVHHSLPFTGLDIALVVGGGLVLIGGGLIARRFTN